MNNEKKRDNWLQEEVKNIRYKKQKKPSVVVEFFEIPSEIIIEILSWLTIQELENFKLVSKTACMFMIENMRIIMHNRYICMYHVKIKLYDVAKRLGNGYVILRSIIKKSIKFVCSQESPTDKPIYNDKHCYTPTTIQTIPYPRYKIETDFIYQGGGNCSSRIQRSVCCHFSID